MPKQKKFKALSAKEADLLSLKVITRAKTGNIRPRLRPDGLHDFVVVGLNCMGCGGEIVADGIGVMCEKDGKRVEAVDGVFWWCDACGEVDENGIPSVFVFNPEESDTPMPCSFCGAYGVVLALPSDGKSKICRECAAKCFELISKIEEKNWASKRTASLHAPLSDDEPF